MVLVFRAQARLRDCLASHHGIAETLSIRRAFHWKLSSSPKGSHSTQHRNRKSLNRGDNLTSLDTMGSARNPLGGDWRYIESDSREDFENLVL